MQVPAATLDATPGHSPTATLGVTLVHAYATGTA